MFGRDVYHWWSFEELEEEVRHAWLAVGREHETYWEIVHRLQEQHAAETVYLRQHNEAMMKMIADVMLVGGPQPMLFGTPLVVDPEMPEGEFKIVSARKP